MSELHQSLSHSKWDCKYHVAFRAQAAAQSNLRQTRRQLGQIFHALAKQKECQIVEGRLMSDHVHMGIAIEPKHPVASVIGFLKGKSAIAIARLCGKGGILRMSISGPAAIGAGPSIHPRAGPRGWNKRASESLSKVRFSATPKPIANRL